MNRIKEIERLIEHFRAHVYNSIADGLDAEYEDDLDFLRDELDAFIVQQDKERGDV